ncbi:MAG: hypothetical protein NTZ51_07425, partial [Proteobacteria bacterium]|nr:hypothetical protein [Pseudomonadota bacterium]
MADKRATLYIASPLGFSEAGRNFMNNKIIPLLKRLDFNVLDPWKLTPQKLIKPVLNMPYGQKKREEWQKLNNIIGSNNTCAIEKA